LQKAKGWNVRLEMGAIDDQERSGPDEKQDASRGDCAQRSAFSGPVALKNYYF
jgi:hypothetical protein